MIGFSPKLPLSVDYVDGISLNKTLKEVLSQNLKHVLLTIPGERIMDPDFGAGLIRYLFNNVNSMLQQQIEADIIEQAGLYVPAVEIEDIEFFISDSPSNNVLMSIKIYYSIPLDGDLQVLELGNVLV